jgi:hypothetical protein
VLHAERARAHVELEAASDAEMPEGLRVIPLASPPSLRDSGDEQANNGRANAKWCFFTT